MNQRYMVAGETYGELRDDGGHGLEHFGVASAWHVPVVVNQDRVQQRGHHLSSYGMKVLGLFDVRFDELENLLLDGAQAPDLWHLGREFACIYLLDSELCVYL